MYRFIAIPPFLACCRSQVFSAVCSGNSGINPGEIDVFSARPALVKR
jgi:hypothetical protein